MSNGDNGLMSPGYIPSQRATPEGRRNFSLADKKRIVAETELPGASLSAVARRHGIDARLLFRWRKDLAPQSEPVFLPVTIADGPEPAGGPAVVSLAAAPPAIPIIVERPACGIEVELAGGRRVRFSNDTDPETVRAMIAMLEGVKP